MLAKINFKPLVLARYLILIEFILILFSTALSNLIEITLYSLCLLTPSIRKEIYNNSKQPLFTASLALIFIIFISTFWSIAPLNSAFGELWGWRKILLLPISLALFCDAKYKDKAINIFLIFTSIICIISLWNLFVEKENGILIRNYATQGMIFSVSLIVFLNKLLLSYKSLNSLKKITYFCLIPIFALGILNIEGRSGYLALIVMVLTSLIIYIYTSKDKWRFILSSLILLIFMSAIFSSKTVLQRVEFGINEIIDTLYREGDGNSSMGIRTNMFILTIETIKENPIFGLGNGSFETEMTNKTKKMKDKGLAIHDPHNQYLKIIAEFGIIGFAVFVYLLISATKQRPEKNSSNYKEIALIVLAAWITTSLFSSHFSTFTEGRFIYLWLGIMLASQKIIVERG